MAIVIVETSDTIKYTLESNIYNQFVLFKNMVEDTNDDSEIHLNNITSKVFDFILKYAEYHKDDLEKKILIKESDLFENIGNFEINQNMFEIKKFPLPKLISFEMYPIEDTDRMKQFTLENKQELEDVIQAADFLDNNHLLGLCCSKFASFLKDKTAEQVAEILGYSKDFDFSNEASEMDVDKKV
jgi:hypothetical protein